MATEWGGVSLAGDTLTFNSRQRAAGTGIYRWRIDAGRLRLIKVNDRTAPVSGARGDAFTFAPSPNTHRRGAGRVGGARP